MTPQDMHATFAQLRALDYPVEMLSKSEINAREPALKTIPDEALFFPSEGAAASPDLARQFLSAAQALGAKLISNVYVNGLKTQNGRVSGIETSVGDMMADQVVIAAGAGTSALVRSIDRNVPLVPRPAYILRTSPQEKLLAHILATPEGEIRQERSGRILMPVVVSHQSDTAQVLSQTPSEAADDAMKRLHQICEGMDNAVWSEVIRAERPMPEDGLPVVGAVADGAYVAVLHSGITLGPIIAEFVAKDIDGGLSNAEAAMLAPYRPGRFQGA
jgi:glycine/D-amino acid oxidase-like deaminating enzyme